MTTFYLFHAVVTLTLILELHLLVVVAARSEPSTSRTCRTAGMIMPPRGHVLDGVSSHTFNHTSSLTYLEPAGLRNSVGVGEHPVTGGIYSVENSGDEIHRDGVDVHTDNPGEEMNFHGTFLNNQFKGQGGNYGYPNCFTAWDATALPNNQNIRTGTPFSNSSNLDYLCKGTIAPRLTFQAHSAPLDVKFNNTGKEGWVTFHGSW